jgi:hypothetical protein
MSSVVRRGLIAGAVGTTALNAVTYADMAWHGRDASSTPGGTAAALAQVMGTTVPGHGRRRSNRLTALGALLGTASGLGVGVAAAVARQVGLRFPAPLDAVLTGAAAMAAADAPMAVLGVTDPRTWSGPDWVSDAVPHLAYGVAVSSTLRSLDADQPTRRATPGLIARSALLGLASGSRSSLGFAAPTLTSSATIADPDGRSGRLARTAAGLGLIGELVIDKLPAAPPRTSAQALPVRFAAATSGAVALARRDGANAAGPAVAGALGAAAGSWGGLAWRRWASSRLPAWQAALIEDGAALTAAAVASRHRPGTVV